MADRRMFAKTIVESDAFTSMSAKAQCLYYRLGMDCDDDGVMNNAMSICRSLGFTKPVLQELLDKRFLLDLGDGVTVIKHWKINNYIQKDRYKPTIYQEQFTRLKVKNDGSYTDCIQNGYSLDTQVRLGKDSIGKVNEEDILLINARLLESGISQGIIDTAMYYRVVYRDMDRDMYMKVIDVLENPDINDKDAYIYRMVENEQNRQACA